MKFVFKHFVFVLFSAAFLNAKAVTMSRPRTMFAENGAKDMASTSMTPHFNF